MSWKDIDRLAAGEGIPHYRIADRLKVSEATFTRWRRKELPEELEKRILTAIEELKEESTID